MKIAVEDLALRVLRDSPLVILVLDLDGRIDHVNPFFERLTGYSLDEVRGKDWFETFLPERDRARIRLVFARSRAGVHVREHVNPIVTRDGDERDIAWTDEFLFDDEGTPRGILAVGSDVTARVQAQVALQVSEARNRAIISALPDLLFRIDGEGRFVDVEAADVNRLAMPPARFLGKTIEEAFAHGFEDSFDDLRAFVEASMGAVARALQTGELQRFEYELRQQWFESRVVRSGPDEVLAIVRDISDLRRTEALLRNAIESRDDLLAIVSHDLRTPLSAIRLATEVLMRSRDPAAVNKQLEVIRSSTVRMNRLIEDLLQAATLDAGAFALEVHQEDVQRILDESMQMLDAVARRKSVRLEVTAERAGSIGCDRDRIIQVLSNLIDNAIRFTPEQGTIRVEARQTQGTVLFSIFDEGPGIEEDELRHVFERYWRRRARGIGLGLYIAKGIVEAHGGRIWAESLAKGSVFRFALPVTSRERGPDPSTHTPTR